MTTYKTMLIDGQTFVFAFNPAEALAPITVNFHNPADATDWQETPYQTACTRHSPTLVAAMLAEHYARDEYDCIEVACVVIIGED